MTQELKEFHARHMSHATPSIPRQPESPEDMTRRLRVENAERLGITLTEYMRVVV